MNSIGESLKKNTECFFAKQYAYLLFSDNDKKVFEVDEILKKDKTILVINEINSVINKYDEIDKKTIQNQSYNRILIDYYYLIDIAKANDTELSIVNEDNPLKLELSWIDKNKFTEAKTDPNFDWTRVK